MAVYPPKRATTAAGIMPQELKRAARCSSLVGTHLGSPLCQYTASIPKSQRGRKSQDIPLMERSLI
ncbi:hypothetical protein TRIATDRAFT_301666 [Trichoderma atroviride IMI 206040]|uniref:Uncharacterized protein n=1 Tax=Hypocrea atroviridis (strain ATCC 20476 / IMI 206040) TaxID=452589 RepID=G9P8E7_HYPAI|nr:uncharacterized protein TRIATDRAFT_301666 [Trichoderma atroviride IMI 206040]EHK40940.1 hypothetical protein TRIATDRAFT_301666 [Trichoderma atroviride IMI 206040]